MSGSASRTNSWQLTPRACALQQEGFASDSVRMIQTLRKESPSVQILLFSATFSERVKNFALRIVGPEANHVFVPKEELSLDVIKQYCVVRFLAIYDLHPPPYPCLIWPKQGQGAALRLTTRSKRRAALSALHWFVWGPDAGALRRSARRLWTRPACCGT